MEMMRKMNLGNENVIFYDNDLPLLTNKIRGLAPIPKYTTTIPNLTGEPLAQGYRSVVKKEMMMKTWTTPPTHPTLQVGPSTQILRETGQMQDLVVIMGHLTPVVQRRLE